MKEKTQIAVIGGGASGMAAAITASRLCGGVTIIESQPRLGKKLIATGNGRCNITNSDISAVHYRSACIDRVESLLSRIDQRDVFDFLGSVGIGLFMDREGRYYPRSEQASSVLDLLRLSLEHHEVDVICDSRVKAIAKEANEYIIITDGGNIKARKVIVACGTNAYPQLGGCMDGVSLLKSLGHSPTRSTPALAPIPVKSPLLKSMKGVRARCKLTLYFGGKIHYSETGELQINEDNLSGIAAFGLSSRIARLDYRKCAVSVDIMPEMSYDKVYRELTQRKTVLGYLAAENMLTGLINKKLAIGLLKQAGIKKLNEKIEKLERGQIENIANTIKDWRFWVSDVPSWRLAQVSSGGVPLDQFDTGLESVYNKGLYTCGELLDCDGDCGGFNLHWAWCTGILAGRSAAAKKKGLENNK